MHAHVHDGPNTLPQPDYGVTQIGDYVVTQRPRARQQQDAGNDRFTGNPQTPTRNGGSPENGGFP
jgi:hypothetical protein